jgi:atypical dual specificity phosphatase
MSPYYFKTLCKENGIEYKRCSIQDMNNPDFVENAEEGVRIMEEVLSSGGNIYVHCSAGIYRSPQMIALYLVAVKKYKLEEALHLLEERHPYAQPSPLVIEQALNLFESNPISSKIRV